MKIDEEVKAFLVKIVVPAFVAISVKLALQSQRQRVSFSTIVTSIIIGIGSAYISSSWVLAVFSTESVPIVIATITIMGEKIGYWILDRFDIGTILDGFVRSFFDKFKK
jgi:hypothetical protein